jgi:predicted hotdog family 3-hydroxylacyl-ACP dehydratase
MDREEIARRIPHAGRMCLLHTVTDWDGARLACTASSHRDADNPMRSHGMLGAACAIEYAGQAMALHGALTAPAGSAPRTGYLAAVRDVELHRERLDDLAADLDIVVERLMGDETRVIYGFDVSCRAQPVASGRATVFLEVNPAR